MNKTMRVAFLAAAAALPVAVLAQGMASYEPQQRLRTSLESCRKTEFESGAYCVMKCAPDFRLDASSKKARCVATKAGATYEPPKPAYTPPPATPGGAKPSGGMG
ncbi:MAG: hypothetical protein IPL06_07480 [Betaproteobacteria bacterium]|nr:hypothetical protein [Betaproteobacteria bacterium]